MRATAADARDNLSCHGEPFHHDLLAIAQAARNSGGIVIAQVSRRSTRADWRSAVRCWNWRSAGRVS